MLPPPRPSLSGLLWSAALLLGLCAPARAQEAARLDPPLPAHGEPWSARVTAYALPPQDIAWLTDDAPERACEVAVTLAPSALATVSPRPAPGCPEGMLQASLAATGSWRFAAPAGVEGPTTLVLRYVFHYNATLGTTMLHVELDPGAENAEERGAPGLQLVHRAGPREPLTAPLPKKARKAGVGPGSCTLRARVDAGGAIRTLMTPEPTSSGPLCPELLVADASKRLRGARLDPKTIDGIPYEDDVLLRVDYVR